MEIHRLDLSFQGLAKAIAAYLVMGPEGPLLVETGPASTVEALRAGLVERGLGPADIRDAFVTHIHLDHAGAAGWLARQGARIHVHPAGAPHLADPSRLLASAARIYGEAMGPLWGETLPVPVAHLRAVADGELVQAAGLSVRALDTPGHAGHHHCWCIGDRVFAGDVAGVRLPGQSLIALPAPPPEFDLEAWERSLDRLRAEAPARIYLTHFGDFEDVAEHLARLRELLQDAAAFVREAMEEGLDRAAILERYAGWNRARAVQAGLAGAELEAYEAANPLAMSVDGLMRYWRKRAGL